MKGVAEIGYIDLCFHQGKQEAEVIEIRVIEIGHLRIMPTMKTEKDVIHEESEGHQWKQDEKSEVH